MNPSIHLVLIDREPGGTTTRSVDGWSPQDTSRVLANPSAVAAWQREQLPGIDADFVCFCDPTVWAPTPEVVAAVTERHGDVWHAGLRLGAGGQPGFIDFAAPTWMLNCDPDPAIEAASWRISLRASVVRRTVLDQLGELRDCYDSLDGAALELGHRWIRRGAACRHVPDLIPEGAEHPQMDVPLTDQLRIVRDQWGRGWFRWCRWRAWLARYASGRALRSACAQIRSDPPAPPPATLVPSGPHGDDGNDDHGNQQAEPHRVTVLIPTIERYPHLRVVLDQLRTQTVKPAEVIVVDQTPIAERDESMPAGFADLPLSWIVMDEAGQCVSRNEGLRVSSGDRILFLDDDLEIEPTLIEQHLQHMARTGADGSCGVANEPGAPLPADFRYCRTSDVFPTNNSMVAREALTGSGLFDLAYNRGSRADGDLGMRLYLSGAHLMLDAENPVLHLHAPRGGLRVHKARRITYASSRSRLLHRHIPSITQLYLHRRYFTDRQRREANWRSTAATLAGRGSIGFRIAKAIAGLILLPHTLLLLRSRLRAAATMLHTFPDIPALPNELSAHRPSTPGA